jgi:hypothetical protein
MWIAVMLMCYDPSALSCMVIAKPEAFYEEQKCLSEAEEVALTMRKKGIYAVPACFEVGKSL